MKWRRLAIASLVFVTSCSRPEPIMVQRLLSPTRGAEISLWHQEAAGTLDSTMLLLIIRPGASFSYKGVKAGIKRGRDVVSYWTAGGEPVLMVRDFDGWTASENGSPSLVICGLPQIACEAALPPSSPKQRIVLGTYHSG